nr:EpsI family protein [Nitrospirota bacterium]
MRLRRHAFPLSVILLGLSLLGVFSIALRPPFKVTDVRLDHIPLQVESSVGTEMHFEDSVYAVLNADGNVLRNYVGPDGKDINLYIGYYGTDKGGRAEHLPQYCFTGQGWSIEKWDFVAFDVSGAGAARVNRMIVNKGDERQLVYFWFQSESTVMSTGWEQNWYKFRRRLLSERMDGTLVRVSMDLPAGKDGEVEERVKRFAQAVMPLVSQFWPIESPVSL